MGSSSGRDARSVAGFLTQMVERMFRSAPAPALDKRTQNLARKRMNIRAVGVREGFQAMRARSEQMTQRLEAFRKQRQHEAPAPIDPAEPDETIVLSSRR